MGEESVFIDCEDGSPNLNFEQVKKNNPDILIAPSMYGIPVVFPKVKNYQIIETVQAIGAKYQGKKIGLKK